MILVTGANGQVGRELSFLSTQFEAYQFIFADRNTLDIADAEQINSLFATHKFRYCINAAAYTAVDKAETETELAAKINTEAVENLAKACQKHNVQLLHLSTDYVYHSDVINRPYVETDDTQPRGVYARTKLAGDLAALQHAPQTIVVRTSWVYSSFGQNFVKTMLRLGRSLKSLRVIFDQIGTPTYARDLAFALLKIVEFLDRQEVQNFGGIYHYSNEGVTSWYDFALAIFEAEGIEIPVAPIETKDYPTPAVRPHFSVLNKAKIKTVFGLEIPHWRESLLDCLDLLEQTEDTH